MSKTAFPLFTKKLWISYLVIGDLFDNRAKLDYNSLIQTSRKNTLRFRTHLILITCKMK